jgi:hypothetical protein
MIMIGGYLYDGGMAAVLQTSAVQHESELAQEEMRWQPISTLVGAVLLATFGSGLTWRSPWRPNGCTTSPSW